MNNSIFHRGGYATLVASPLSLGGGAYDRHDQRGDARIIDRVYPVGIIVDFAVEMDPNSAVGFGTQWQRIADGRTLIASDGSILWDGWAAQRRTNLQRQRCPVTTTPSPRS